MAIEFEATQVASPGVEAGGPARAVTGETRLSAGARVALFERLALLLETGSALHAALKTLAEQSAEPGVRAMLEQILDMVLQGAPFSEALHRHPRAFPPSHVHIIAAGERAGFLPRALGELKAMDERQERVMGVVRSAAAYPLFLVAMSIGVVVFVLVSVFPRFAEMFAGIRDSLPWTTVTLLALSDLLTKHWWAVLAALGALLAALLLWWRQPGSAERIDALKLHTPILRDICVQIDLVRVMRVMGISLGNGVSVLDALKAAQSVAGNAAFRQLLQDLAQDVNQGKRLAEGFAAASFVPPLARQMIATGEQAGKLALVMERLADHYEALLTRRIGMLTRLAEPVLLLVMGVVVAVIVSALILPIFKLARAVH